MKTMRGAWNGLVTVLCGISSCVSACVRADSSSLAPTDPNVVVSEIDTAGKGDGHLPDPKGETAKSGATERAPRDCAGPLTFDDEILEAIVREPASESVEQIEAIHGDGRAVRTLGGIECLNRPLVTYDTLDLSRVLLVSFVLSSPGGPSP